jgi:ABC-type branched-subunit amino acid transport system ATPase component
MLEGSEIRKTYGAFVALGGVTISVEGGKILGVAGPNGAGKTTLFDVPDGPRQA